MENFVDKVKVWWASYLFQGNPSFILAKKLATLKLDLKKWNAEFGNVTFKKQLLWNKLEQTNLHTDIEKLTLLEEISWRQKSRVLHLRVGDTNTKFFHRMANSNRRNNSIESLMFDGILFSNQGMIADCITQFFVNLYSEQQVDQLLLEVLVFPRKSDDNANWQDRPFKEAKIFEVIQNFNGDKSPKPNGFPMAFFQDCWGILKLDLMAVFHLFFAKGQFEKSLIPTFITLIP